MEFIALLISIALAGLSFGLVVFLDRLKGEQS